MKNQKNVYWRSRLAKSLWVSIALLLANTMLFGQTSGSITVGGDINTFYPVSWYDSNWYANKNTHLSIGRSNVHTNAQWRGSMVGEFTFHTNNWGNGSHFFDVKLSQIITTNSNVYTTFVAGWTDATVSNGDRTVVIWLRGGGTTYYYEADADVRAKVYDGTQNALPYVSSNGNVTANVKTAVDDYVKNGFSSSLPINMYGTASNYLNGSLGIGIQNPTEKLAVNGTIRAKEIKVEAAPWPDYVFAESYDLPSLKETENFIKTNKHLPDMPNAQDVEANGVALGEMNRLLLQKVEELTLHLIEKDKAISVLQEQIKEIDVLKMQLNDLKKTIKTNK